MRTENPLTSIPMVAQHRLENPGKITPPLIERQFGTCLGKEALVRDEAIQKRH